MLWRSEKIHVWRRTEILLESCRGCGLRKVIIPSLPETNSKSSLAPENRPKPRRKSHLPTKVSGRVDNNGRSPVSSVAHLKRKLI